MRLILKNPRRISACFVSPVGYTDELLFSRKFLKRILPWWFLILTAGSFLPVEAKRALGTRPPAHRPEPCESCTGPVHRAYHIGAFGLSGLLVSLVNRRTRDRLRAQTGVLALGVAIEVVQFLSFKTNFTTEFEWWDIRDDGYGIAASLLLGHLSLIRRFLLQDEHLPGDSSDTIDALQKTG